jgi:hypothetical protein
MILRDFSLGLDKEYLLELYKYCTDDIASFLLIDIDVPPEERFRKGFFEIINVPM